MGKGAELWDDSALISAFDAAMASYKEIHNGSSSEHSLEKEKDESNKKGSDIVLTRENYESNTIGNDVVFNEVAKSGIKIESECSSHDLNDNMKETSGSSWSDPSTQQKNVGDTCAASDFKAPISDHPFMDPNIECYSDHQIQNYNELLKQYYELEQRKAKIADQLWSANYWNHQTPAQCSTSQEQQVPVSSCSELNPSISCPCCTCQCLTTTSISTCPVASSLCAGYACCPQRLCCFGSQVQQEAGVAHFSSKDAFSMNSIKHSTQEDGGIVETGIVPIEMVTNPEANLSKKLNLSEEKKGEHDVSSTSKCPRTDLTSVLNAWYWAGFKTGRYLLEQEHADKLNRQG